MLTILLLTLFGVTAASAHVLACEPQIVEFGPTFRSPLGDIIVGPDGAIWATESDGMARLTRDGRVSQVRRPDDAYYIPTSGIGIGPAGSVWANGRDRLLRFTGSGVREIDRASSFDRTVATDYSQRITAFAATPTGIYTARESERGVRLTIPGKPDRQAFSDSGYISEIFPAPGRALWLIGGSRRSRASLILASQTAIRQRSVATSFVANHEFSGHFAVASDGGLIATVSATIRPGQQGWPSAALVHIATDGKVRELAQLPGEKWEGGVGAISAGPNGDVWFTEPYANRIVRVASDGTQREYRDHIPAGASPSGIAVDRDDSVWYTDAVRATIGHLWPADGHVRIFGNALMPNNAPGPPVIAADGAVWFRETLDWHRRIARLTLDGAVQEYLDPIGRDCINRRGSGCSALRAAGRGIVFTNSNLDERAFGPHAKLLLPDGALRDVSLDGCLKTETNVACLPELRGRGVLTYPFEVQNDSSIAPNSAVVGPDGNVWFTDRDRSAIGRLTRDGRFTFFTHGLTRWDSGPQYITVGPDGALWFTEIRDRIGRITTAGRITEYSAGIPFRSSIGGIVTGPDKNLWFTLYHGNELARMTTAGSIARFRHGIYPSRGFDESTDSVPFVDRSGNIWFNEPQGGRIARATIPRRSMRRHSVGKFGSRGGRIMRPMTSR